MAQTFFKMALALAVAAGLSACVPSSGHFYGGGGGGSSRSGESLADSQDRSGSMNPGESMSSPGTTPGGGSTSFGAISG